MSYTPVTVTGYNANPPEDDGTHVSTNEVTWEGIKEKLGDPLKTAIDGIQTALGVAFGTLSAETGTVMIFRQTAAPTGWSKLLTHDNHALRCVTGTVGTGGSTNFTSVFTARSILQANLPAVTWPKTLAVGVGTLDIHASGGDNHTNFLRGGVVTSPRAADAGGTANVSVNQVQVDLSLTGAPSLTGDTTSGGSDTALDFAVKYIDVIEASKD